jgi:hypothetical protein
MKGRLFYLLFAIFFCSACDKNSILSEDLPDLNEIKIADRPCETLAYIGQLDYDFDSALDSLVKLKNISGEIQKVPLTAIFDHDDRYFCGILYGECGNYADVLDSKGNYYSRTWYCPEDSETLDILEETIFKETKTFKIIQGPCGTITYQNRIGTDFNQALDSIIILKKPFLEGLTSDEYYIDKETVSVDFENDDRTFIAIGFRRIKDDIYIFSVSSVLDSKGNHFVINWCED